MSTSTCCEAGTGHDSASRDTASRDYALLATRLEAGTLDPQAFSHADHVGVAYEILRGRPFLDAAAVFGGSLHAVATRAGAPEKFNTTVTLAFLSLIAERMEAARYPDAHAFLAANPELLEGGVLDRWYAPGQLSSELARTTFMMPRPPAEAGHDTIPAQVESTEPGG